MANTLEPGFRAANAKGESVLPVQGQPMTVGVLPLAVARRMIADKGPTAPVL